ncbi:MAG: helix-turn-helix transcriptional regulator [Chloroflexi bacterium]|nr:helix-turn-helix transcriptional regulator [Chloroflexota bacterium]MQC16917.1 XRE family transcriptional regulator [Chloroflexota bacterium]MQC48234.1 XRE family transcriptional regulator [Chloroflexota bacterium]
MSEIPDNWDANAVRDLRGRLSLTQAELAEQIGTRQQTISEWEVGVSRPRRMSQRLLRMVAETSRAYDSDVPAETHHRGLIAPAPASLGSSHVTASSAESADIER